MRTKKILEEIKKERIIQGFNQKQIADKLGLSEASYSRIETGKAKITCENLEKISTILNKKFCGSESNNSLINSEKLIPLIKENHAINLELLKHLKELR